MKSTFIKSTFIKKQKKWPKHVEDLCPTIFFVGYLPFSGQFRNKYAGLDFLGCCRDQISFLTAGTSISPKGAVSYTTNTRVHTLYTCCMYVDDGLSISVGEIVFQHSSKTALAAPAPPKTLPDKKLLTPYVKYCVSLEHVHGSQKILFGQFRRIRRVIPRCNTSVEMAVWP